MVSSKRMPSSQKLCIERDGRMVAEGEPSMPGAKDKRVYVQRIRRKGRGQHSGRQGRLGAEKRERFSS